MPARAWVGPAWVAAAGVLVPLLAGCAGPVALPPPDPPLEAFTATYEEEQGTFHVVRLDGPRLALAADGALRPSWVLAVNSTAQTLGADLRPTGHMDCIRKADTCRRFRHLFLERDQGPIPPIFGVAANVALPEGAVRSPAGAGWEVVTPSARFAFADGLLAPSAIHARTELGEQPLLRRTAYVAGPPLAAEPQPLQAMPLEPVAGASWPGAGQAWPAWGFSLQQAVEYLAGEADPVRQALRAGACVVALQVQATGDGSDLWLGLGEQATAVVHLVLAGNTTGVAAEVRWGQPALAPGTATPRFLSAATQPVPERFDCAKRPAHAMAMGDALRLAERVAGGLRLAGMGWEDGPGGPRLVGQWASPEAVVWTDGNSGLLLEAHTRTPLW